MVLWAEMLAVFVTAWLVATTGIEACLRRRQAVSLADRLWPYRTSSVADEAHEWLADR